MENIELLVKLASFGTAGVSVLAIFYIGYCIQKLPNSAPDWKPALMKKYMNMCIIIAIICTVSGGLNAYFNRGKIVAAEDAKSKLEAGYEEQSQNVESAKRAVTASFNSLREALRSQHVARGPAVTAAIDSADVRIHRIQLKPKSELLKGIVGKPNGH